MATRALEFPDTGSVMVFGGSGGAGSAICEAFAGAGCEVAFTYHSNVDRAKQLETDLAAPGRRVRGYRLDLTDAAAIAGTVDSVRADFGDIHTVVYAAGPKFDFMNVSDVPPDVFTRIANAELLGFFNIAHATMPTLRANAGNIVACLTYGIRRVLPLDGQSAAPKAGIESLVRQIAWEEAAHGVRANAVGLGWMNFGLGALDGGERSMLRGETGDQVRAELERKVPMGRPGRPGELADPVLFLASKQASYITGQCLMADGGISL